MSIIRHKQTMFSSDEKLPVNDQSFFCEDDYWLQRELTSVDVNGHLLTEEEIEKELRTQHKIHIKKPDQIENLEPDMVNIFYDDNAIYSYITGSYSRRVRYLLNRLLYFKKQKTTEQSSSQSMDVDQHNKSRVRVVLRSISDVGKKFIDIIDDVWSALKNTPLPKNIIELLNPFLIGIAGGIVNLAESIFGFKRAYKSYKNVNIGQRKTRIVTGIIAGMLGLVGTAGAAMLIASAASTTTIISVAFMPIIIPSTLLGIYSVMLLRKCYTLHRAIQEEEKEEAEYRRAQKEYQSELNNLQNHSLILKRKLDEYCQEYKIENILKKHDRGEKLVCDEKKKLEGYKHYLELQDKLDVRYQELQEKFSPARKKYEQCREERLKAERKVAMNTFEVAASGMVLAGTILGLSAILGAASVASFGVLPLALIITGVVIGVAIKIFEKIDDKKGNKLSRGIRGFFSRLFSRESEAKPQIELQPQVDTPALAIPQSTTASMVRVLSSSGITVEPQVDLPSVRPVETPKSDATSPHAEKAAQIGHKLTRHVGMPI